MVEKASHSLSILLDNFKGPLTYGDLLRAIEEKGYGLLLTVSSLFVVVPAPPGLDVLPGLIMMVWGIQRLLGRSTPWLPKFIRDRVISEKALDFIRTKGIRFLAWLEGLFPSTGRTVDANPWETKAASFIVTLMATLVFLPTPFLNSIPAAIITAVGLGILNGNKYLIWSSFVAGLVAFALIGNVLWFGTDKLLELFAVWF